MRKIKFAKGEYYHIFNRGVDKRVIFSEEADFQRFFQSMTVFNAVQPIGSIREDAARKANSINLVSGDDKLVNFVCYCLNPNHYHFILEQLDEKGIEKFMHRMGVGYTKYFNQKHNRNGSLLQGTFQAIHIDSNDYLLHLSAYVNLNNRVHQLGSSASKSSWDEYIGGRDGFCEKGIILEQFNNEMEYRKFAEGSLDDIKKRKDMERFLIE